VLGAEDCGLTTLPQEIARLPRLRKLNLGDNPLTSLPFGPESFRKVEILSIGDDSYNGSPDFTANLDLARFPWLRVVEQRYDVNTVDELVYRDSHDLWDNPHLEILDIGWPSLRNGLPAGLLKARNLRALASRVNVAQLGSFMAGGQYFERLEYLAIAIPI
jgi:Leucine-rich repeat (LRR) protein